MDYQTPDLLFRCNKAFGREKIRKQELSDTECMICACICSHENCSQDDASAALEPKAADDIISAHPEIKSWMLAGHSMGGLTASGYADDHRDTVDGLILIAAYTNRDMSDAEMPVLAVFGDADGVMNKGLYDKRLAWNSADFEEHIIPGANHAQYGDYGKQPRDNDATISAEEQQSQAAIFVGILLLF